MKSQLLPEFLIERNENRCIRCGVCLRQCGFEVHNHDEEIDQMVYELYGLTPEEIEIVENAV